MSRKNMMIEEQDQMIDGGSCTYEVHLYIGGEVAIGVEGNNAEDAGANAVKVMNELLTNNSAFKTLSVNVSVSAVEPFTDDEDEDYEDEEDEDYEDEEFYGDEFDDIDDEDETTWA